jgi:hypothetical protein
MKLTHYGRESIEKLFRIQPSSHKTTFLQNPKNIDNKKQSIEDFFYSVPDRSKIGISFDKKDFK